jgi:azurin
MAVGLLNSQPYVVTLPLIKYTYMIKLNMKPVYAVALGAVFFAACNNNPPASQENTQNADTAHKTPDTVKTPPAPAGKVVTGKDIEIHAVGNTMAEMKFDVSEMHVPAHSDIKITLHNDGTDMTMVHNIVILKPEDADSVAVEGQRAGLKNNFVPDDKARVIAGSKVTQPGAKTVLKFKSPDKGEYLFMCTYPGHSRIMRGKLVVE